jgi:predicted DNA-binding transcriptional regulator AlpA
MEPKAQAPSPTEALDRFIRIEEASQVISHSKSWIYGHREQLPFVVRTPEGTLRVSVLRLRRWMESAESGPSIAPNGNGRQELEGAEASERPEG